MALFARTQPESVRARAKAALDAVLRVSEIASSNLGLKEAVQAMLASATDLLQAEQGSIMLLEDDGHTLVLVASSGLPSKVPLGHRLTAGESVAGRVLVTGKPLLLGDIDRAQFVNFVPKSRPISSSIVVPMRAHGRAWGVLSLALSEPSSRFVDDDLRIAQMFADQAGGLLYKARLHERAEQRSADLTLLVDSSKGLLGTLDTEALLQQVLDGATRLVDGGDGFACLFDPESGSIQTGVFRGLDKATIRSLLQHAEIRAAVERMELRMLRVDELGELAAMGLAATRGIKGVFVVLMSEPLATEKQGLLKAFGQQCASAIGAAGLYSMVQRKESELSAIIQAVPNPIIMIDAWGKIVAINPAAEELFGVSLVFSAGAPVSAVLANPQIERLLSQRGQTQDEVLAGHPPRTYKVRVTDVRVPGAPMGRVLIMDDVTSEREIAQIQRDFVSMIGHELRTPLTIVKGFARTLLRRIDEATPEELREALATIDDRSAQLERLIEDLLSVSRVESREAALRIEEVKLAYLVGSVADELLQEHSDREIILDISQSLTWPCDETKLRLVLRHLLENALKYSDAPNAVKIRAAPEDGELRVEIADKGKGLVSTDIPRIFERFRQVDNSSTREHGGTGVGLYLCAQLVRMHGGRIWVDSAWGKGSVFSFALPARDSGDVVHIRGRLKEADASPRRSGDAEPQ